MASLAASYDIVIDEGADWAETYTLYDENDALIDLTGYTIEMHIRENIADTTPKLLSTGGTPTITITNGTTAGTIGVSIDSADLESLDWVNGFYDIEIEDGSGNKERILMGKVTVRKEVTR